VETQTRTEQPNDLGVDFQTTQERVDGIMLPAFGLLALALILAWAPRVLSATLISRK
jgi:hypothetical protein